jgi:very-short-patch-repair endonuclease
MSSTAPCGRGRGPDMRSMLGEVRGSHIMRDNANLNAAKLLRQSETLPEKKLWEQLRSRNCGGFKFVRQAPIGPYIADFVCRKKMLIVELDGWTHSTPEELAHDTRRTAYLNNLGYRVVRYGNDSAMHGMDGLLTLILGELRK